MLLNPGGGGGSLPYHEFIQQSANPGGVPTNTLYQDDGTNYPAGSLVWSNQLRVTGVTTLESNLQFVSATVLNGLTDGRLLLTDDAGTGFDMIQLGGTTAAFPAVSNNSGNIELRNAADTGQTSLLAFTGLFSGDVRAGAGRLIHWAGLSEMVSTVDGNITIRNDAATDFGLLQLGGTTSAFPALKRSTVDLEARLADDSAYTDITALDFNLSGGGSLGAHVADATIHFTEASIDHLNISNIGVNSHATIDTHLASTSNPHSVSLGQARTVSNIFAGPILGSFGSGAAPTYAFDTDTGTGVFREAASTLGLTAGGAQMVSLSGSLLDFGTRANRTFEVSNEPTAYGGFVFLPDGKTRTDVGTNTAAITCVSSITTNVPGGAPFGNDTAPAAIQWIPTVTFADQGFLFATQLLINAAAELRAQANLGPVYLFLDQYKHIGDGGVRTCSQHSALRIQPSWGPNINGGSITQADATYILNTATVDATVGSAAITSLTYWQASSPTLTAGGTVGTFRGIRFDDISGPGTILGISSAMSSGTFVDHTGSAPSNFAGSVRINNGVNLTLGTDGGNRVSLQRSAAGILRMFGQGGTNNEDLRFNMDGAANNVTLDSTTGAGLRVSHAAVSIGATSADPTGSNWQFALTPGAKTITTAGDFARALFSSSANVTINAALTNFATWIINSPAGTIGSGSATNAANVLVQTAPGVGTNRYGVLITSNPSGGTLNYAFRQSNASARARFDGRLDINRGIALGVGAPATLGLTGGSGPTTSTQAQWLEIDIGGVAHWIPVWT